MHEGANAGLAGENDPDLPSNPRQNCYAGARCQRPQRQEFSNNPVSWPCRKGGTGPVRVAALLHPFAASSPSAACRRVGEPLDLPDDPAC